MTASPGCRATDGSLLGSTCVATFAGWVQGAARGGGLSLTGTATAPLGRRHPRLPRTLPSLAAPEWAAGSARWRGSPAGQGTQGPACRTSWPSTRPIRNAAGAASLSRLPKRWLTGVEAKFGGWLLCDNVPLQVPPHQAGTLCKHLGPARAHAWPLHMHIHRPCMDQHTA